ncbi:MAG TPA: delta-lactam-biosynthetic de-N-acetylase [Clostridia bacterium]
MRSYILAITLFAFLALTGCAIDNGQSISSETNNIVDKRSAEKEDTLKSTNENAGETAIKATAKPTPKAQENGTPATSTPKASTEPVKGKSDNVLSWWLSLNSRHETPAIPAEAAKLVKKYDGIYLGNTKDKTVYLTFDEGYENGYTSKILDTLKGNNVKAIFFITGPYLKQNEALVKRMVDEGHLVGNHTINHKSMPTLSDQSIRDELTGVSNDFNRLFNKDMHFFRPPNGEYSDRVLKEARELGYRTVFWSFAYRDFDVNNQKGADYAHNMVMKNLHNGGVFLLHAVSKDNSEALDRIIKDIRAQGYTISPFDF